MTAGEGAGPRGATPAACPCAWAQTALYIPWLLAPGVLPGVGRVPASVPSPWPRWLRSRAAPSAQSGTLCPGQGHCPPDQVVAQREAEAGKAVGWAIPRRPKMRGAERSPHILVCPPPQLGGP